MDVLILMKSKMDKVKLKIYSTTGNLPEYGSKHAAGADVRALERFVLHRGERHLFKTGLFVEIPIGYELQVRPRSGMALKQGISIVNTPGTIDADYRGEIGIILINHGDEVVVIEEGTKIAQLVLNQAPQADFIKVNTYEELESSDRGEGGFGSTGTH